MVLFCFLSSPLQYHARRVLPLRKVTCTTEVPPEVQILLGTPCDEITFTHLDPTEVLVRMLVSGPLAADPANMQVFPRLSSTTYDDYADGERMARIHNALPRGTAALSSILFFDEINRDAKGFVTGDGAIIVGGFFKRHARESTYAKISLGTFPQLGVPHVNRNRKAIRQFRKLLKRRHHASILECYHQYNRRGGQLVPMQQGPDVYFLRAVILAIYADQPAAVKCSLTGSACPSCFFRQSIMANAPLGDMLKRTDAAMARKQRELHEYANRGDRGDVQRAKTRAKKLGVQWDDLSPWSNFGRGPSEWVFGPDPILDNIYQCLPQVTLHGMDEGLIMKLNYGVLELYIAHRSAEHNESAAVVRTFTCESHNRLNQHPFPHPTPSFALYRHVAGWTGFLRTWPLVRPQIRTLSLEVVTASNSFRGGSLSGSAKSAVSTAVGTSPSPGTCMCFSLVTTCFLRKIKRG